MTATRGFLCLVPAMIATTVVFAPPAGAEGRDPRLHGNFAVVFDSSGSMRGATADAAATVPKIAVARAFGRALFGRLRERSGIEGALIVFGSNYDSNQPGSRTAGCRDVSIRVGLRPMDAAAVAAAVDAIGATRARGYTPLGRAVQEAVDLLGPSGGSIVVVTDLEETCEDDTPQHACNVLAGVNAQRMPANRVYFDSIVVTRSAEMNMDAVNRLRDCTHAPVVEATNEAQANEMATIVATRLGDLADQGDRPGTPTPSPTPAALRLTVIDARGGGSGRTETTVVLRNRAASIEHSLSSAVGAIDLSMVPGTYEVSTEDGRGSVLMLGTVEVTRETVELVVSIAAP